jgi:hypothetical protein
MFTSFSIASGPKMLANLPLLFSFPTFMSNISEAEYFYYFILELGEVGDQVSQLIHGVSVIIMEVFPLSSTISWFRW